MRVCVLLKILSLLMLHCEYMCVHVCVCVCVYVCVCTSLSHACCVKHYALCTFPHLYKQNESKTHLETQTLILWNRLTTRSLTSRDQDSKTWERKSSSITDWLVEQFRSATLMQQSHWSNRKILYWSLSDQADSGSCSASTRPPRHPCRRKKDR